MDRVKFYINEKTHTRRLRPWIRAVRDSKNIADAEDRQRSATNKKRNST